MKLLLTLLLFISCFFVTVYSDENQDLEVCHKTCSLEFRPRIVNLFRLERVYSDYEDLVPFWTTCQYRCYRCGLDNSSAFMKELEQMFDSNTASSPQAIVEITKLMIGIDTNLKECYDNWMKADNAGDTTSTF